MTILSKSFYEPRKIRHNIMKFIAYQTPDTEFSGVLLVYDILDFNKENGVALFTLMLSRPGQVRILKHFHFLLLTEQEQWPQSDRNRFH